mmetsp:Transcript_4232/g.17152  ORF Transcript_4232/g.17152 Transcript_4232/m.17152 type:complete len:233 (-) Transcript_4232:2667-3365(-)
MSTTSAASTATCVPPANATPTSAFASAGASLTPSPTIATLWPPARCNDATTAALSAGSTPAVTWAASMPTCLATASAVCSWSPVSMRTSSPKRRFSVLTAAAASGRAGSAMPTTPSRRHDDVAGFESTRTAVLAWARSMSTSGPASVSTVLAAQPSSSARSGEPTATSRVVVVVPACGPVCSVAVTPRPGITVDATSASRRKPLVLASSTMARASGCSEPSSAAAASRRSRV